MPRGMESAVSSPRTEPGIDWEGDDAQTTAWITILSKVLGVDPPTKN